MTIIQAPNKEIIAALVAAIVSHISHGLPHNAASSLFYVFLIIWAYREAAEGVNWFRRGLGLVVMVYIATSLALSW